MKVIRTSRALLAGAAIALIGAAAAVAVPAFAAPQHAAVPVTSGSYYLALGDSVPFGFREATNTPAPNYTKAANFTGYPEIVGKTLGLKVINAACPGETSSSFINTSAQSNGCEADSTGIKQAGYRSNFPLHQSYSGSQLAFAQSFLKTHKTTTKLITLTIGANDGFICQAGTADHCTSPGEITPVVVKIETNVNTIVKALRKTGYLGQIVIVNYYSTDYTNTPTGVATTLGVTAINNGLDTGASSNNNAYAVRVGSPFNSFRSDAAQTSGDVCKAGLLTILTATSPPSAPCGVHPSVAGQYIIATVAIGAIAK